MKKTAKKLLRKYRKHLWSYISIAAAIFLVALGILIFRSAQIGKIYPNVYIGDLNFGGMTKTEAQDILNKKGQTLLESGITLKVKNKEIQASLLQFATGDPDLSRDLIKFNAAQTAEKLYYIGRYPKKPLTNLKDTLAVIFSKKNQKIGVEFTEHDLIEYLKHKLDEYEAPTQNASIVFNGNDVSIKKEKVGTKINYDNLFKKLKAQLELLQKPYLAVEVTSDEPEIKKHEVEDMVSDIEQAIGRAPLSVKHKNKKWYITRWMMKEYLDFERIDDVATLVLSEKKSLPFFEKIAKSIDIPARNAKFTIKDGRVAEFQTSLLGVKFNQNSTRDALNNVLTDGFPTVFAIVESDEPETTTADANDMGISDLLGTGESNFTGSPKNRIHNIETGAKILNGILIKPGEEFSLLTALGDIDDKNGFKPELVIKEGKTIPEFGGGLCQIGTTVFRGAIDSGMPITERRNHSYRVGYYEPAGTDATIYSPAPDFKFLNDTPGHILILTKIEEMKLTFEFWGKYDGREITYTKPTIENIVEPPPTKYIITTELAPGKKKKVESAHKGADAYFQYTVKYNNEKKEDIDTIFYSHYRPWAEVWMMGATSTETSI